MLEVAVQAVRGCGASPVLLAAMGSHGGGTRQGQKDVLDSLGITEERLGAPVITCDVTRAIWETPGGLVAYMLESAFGVDAIIPINRVKTHTSFKGCVESGLCKNCLLYTSPAAAARSTMRGCLRHRPKSGGGTSNAGGIWAAQS